MSKVRYITRKNRLLNITPNRIITLGFFILILFGTLLLSLPISSSTGSTTNIVDTLFTATSASCVTGLVVVDTATHWSLFGQLVILLLIQVGGLGIVTLATFFSVVFGKKVGIKGQILAKESMNSFSFREVTNLIKKVVLYSLFFELIGAILLSFKFVPLYGLKGIFMGIFHSISAFCNAGFDIFGNYSSLTKFKEDPFVLLTIIPLIIIGGLGFIVWKDIYQYKQNKTFNLHTKVVFVFTGGLIVLGTILYYIFEITNPNTLMPLDHFDIISNSLFQSVTTRTAGFNTFDLHGMNDISKFITVLFMFIGAAPGSTGGGVKITTFAILIMSIFSYIRGYDKTIILGKVIVFKTLIRTLTIISLSWFIVIIITILLLIFESKPFLDILFLATSAFGTVGLSTIDLSEISTFSKIVIMFTMLLGRVGPLTFAIAITLRGNSQSEVIYPEGKIVIG